MVPRVIAGLSDSELHAEYRKSVLDEPMDAAVADSPARPLELPPRAGRLPAAVCHRQRGNRARVAVADSRSGRGGSDNMAPTMPPRLRAADPRAVVPRRLAAPSWRRGIRLAVLLFAGVTAIGTIGYMVIEGWSAWDAFYMTIISVTTAGYREVHPMSRAGEAWTSVVLICGVSTLFYTASAHHGGLSSRAGSSKRESRRFKRMLDELKQHFIICGYGRIGSVIADEFRRQRCRMWSSIVIRIACTGHRRRRDGHRGGCEPRRRAHGAGIERARGLIAAVGSDAENVYTVLTASGLNPTLFIIARSESRMPNPSCCAPARIVCFRRINWAASRWPPPRCVPPWWTSCGWRSARSGSSCRPSRSRLARARRWSGAPSRTPTCARTSASSSWPSSGRPATWSSIRRRKR